MLLRLEVESIVASFRLREPIFVYIFAVFWAVRCLTAAAEQWEDRFATRMLWCILTGRRSERGGAILHTGEVWHRVTKATKIKSRPLQSN